MRVVTSTVRWVRTGDDRLHVSAPDGRRLGWFDLRTGTAQVLDADPGAAEQVQAAVDEYVASTSPLRRRRPVQALATRAPAPRQDRTSPAVAGPGPEDLRDRLPGEHVTRLLVGRARRPHAASRWWPSARDPLGPALRHAHQAALGQQQVAAVLAGLGPAWHVLHAVPTSGCSWLDHLLVGPGGVLVLRTAAHPGEAVRFQGSLVRAGGRPVSHVRLLRQQTRTVTERLRGADLPVAVRGVVVVVGARSVRADDLPAGVTVVRLEDLAGWVAGLPTVLSRVDVSRLAETAARPGTWPPELDRPADADERRRLREEDRAALARLTVRARDAGRVRLARRAVLLAGTASSAVAVLLSSRPDVLPHAVAAVGMIGG